MSATKAKTASGPKAATGAAIPQLADHPPLAALLAKKGALLRDLESARDELSAIRSALGGCDVSELDVSALKMLGNDTSDAERRLELTNKANALASRVRVGERAAELLESEIEHAKLDAVNTLSARFDRDTFNPAKRDFHDACEVALGELRRCRITFDQAKSNGLSPGRGSFPVNFEKMEFWLVEAIKGAAPGDE
jgi:hypothetical protein